MQSPETKIARVRSGKLSKVNIRVVDVEEEVEFTGQSMVFTLPVVIIKMDDKEMYRFARSFSVYEVLDKLKRLSGEQPNS